MYYVVLWGAINIDSYIIFVIRVYKGWSPIYMGCCWYSLDDVTSIVSHSRDITLKKANISGAALYSRIINIYSRSSFFILCTPSRGIPNSYLPNILLGPDTSPDRQTTKMYIRISIPDCVLYNKRWIIHNFFCFPIIKEEWKERREMANMIIIGLESLVFFCFFHFVKTRQQWERLDRLNETIAIYDFVTI